MANIYVFRTLFNSVYLGGTTDITVHQLQENKTLAKVVLACGGEWGGINVDGAYWQFLKNIFGIGVLNRFQSDPEETIDYFEFWQNFEVKKRESVSSKKSKKIRLAIPTALIEIAKHYKKINGNHC